MASPPVMTETEQSSSTGDDGGVDNIIRTFMIEQERIRGSQQRGRRNSVVDQIFRGQGQQLQDSSSPPNSDVGRQLAEISRQLDQHFYQEETDNHIEILERRPASRMDNLRRIIQGVFQHGITAGHVMSLLIFGFRYISHLVNNGIENAEDICRQIMSSIIKYIKDYVVAWIKSIGGWNGFLDEVKQYTEQARQWNVNRLHLLVGFVVVVTAVNVGAVVWRYK
ncbi:apoptosis regulator R1-like [Bolinopsis microptera]|uniref:apoptosis regulator R1-like n=1 Tax=Bolinopsis microptera TaxID=2820187 RepID=UPI003078D6CB